MVNHSCAWSVSLSFSDVSGFVLTTSVLFASVARSILSSNDEDEHSNLRVGIVKHSIGLGSGKDFPSFSMITAQATAYNASAFCEPSPVRRFEVFALCF